MTGSSKRWLERFLRWVLGVVFVVAAMGVPGTSWGSGKLAHPSRFAQTIRTYRMVPAVLIFPMAMYLPWLELTVGLGLLAGVWRREFLWLTLGLCAMFLGANLTAMARGLEVDCGCFGAGYHGSAAREALIATILSILGVGALKTNAPRTI